MSTPNPDFSPAVPANPTPTGEVVGPAARRTALSLRAEAVGADLERELDSDDSNLENGTVPRLELEKSEGQAENNGESHRDFESNFESNFESDLAHKLNTAPAASALSAEAAEESSLREFYAQLVGLLTQESAGTPKKPNRNNLLATLRRRWLPGLLVGSLAMIGLTYALRPRQSTYLSTVTLLLPPRALAGAQNTDLFASPEESYDTEAELAIIGSETIVQEALSRVPAPLKARGWGNKNVDFAPVDAVSFGSDSLINISVSSLDAAASYQLSREMVHAYTDYTRSRYEQNRAENLKITRQRVTESGNLLKSARDKLRLYKERSGVFNTAEGQGVSGSVAGLEEALASAKSGAPSSGSSGGNGPTADSRLDILRAQSLEALTAYQNVLRDFEPSSARAQSAERKWRGLTAQTQTRSREIQAQSARRIRQIEGSLRVARGRAAALPGIEQSLNQLNERVQLLETAYRAASDRYNQLNLARGTVAPTARVLHSPNVVSSRRGQWVRALAVSLVASLGLGILGAWLTNRMDRSVRTISDPGELFDVPILGVMPAIAGGATGGGAISAGATKRGVTKGGAGGKSGLQRSGLVTKRGHSSLQTATIEACYITQNNLVAAARAFEARSILITSAVPGEGKSQCAANLATAMAYGGQNVLLIDADFLHPTQHDILKMSLEPGYAQVLAEEIELTQAVRATSVANLDLLSAGKNSLKTPEDMVSLLAGAVHGRQLKRLEKFYDVILIDGPPTMSMSDAQLLSNMADSIVLVTAEGTHQEEVYRARSMLRLTGGLLLGVIINRVSLREMSGWNLDFAAEAPFSNYATSLRGRAH